MEKFQCIFYKCLADDSVKRSEDLLRLIDSALKMFEMYTHNSFEKYPQQILYNLTKNNEKIFAAAESDIKSSTIAFTGNESDDRTLTFKEQSSIARNRLFYEDETEEAMESESIETDVAQQESVKICNTDEEFINSEENAEMGFNVASGTHRRSNVKQKRDCNELEDNIRTMLARNLMNIASVSIKLEEDIGVEIFTYSPSESPPSDENPAEDLKQDLWYPDTSSANERTELAPSEPFKAPKKVNESLPGLRKTNQRVDYSHPWVCYFLSQRLLSILWSRKTYMKQICNSLKKCLVVISQIKGSIMGITQLIKDFGMADESYFEYELGGIRNEVVTEASEMSKKSDQLTKGIKRKGSVYESCLQDIDSFENELVLRLTKSMQVQTIQDLIKLYLCLKKICKKVDDDVLFYHERQKNLLNFAFDFERLVKHFVKYLIIKGILGRPLILKSPKESAFPRPGSYIW